MTSPAADVFDVPCRWRDTAAAALQLEGESVMAAMSPGAAFPAALRTIAANVSSGVHTVADLGAGAGGASEWLRRELDAKVIAIEPAAVARDVARRRFPALDVRDGRADRTGLPDASVDLVVLSGVLSLIDDLEPVLGEVDRVGRPGGFVAVADLFAAEAHTFSSAPNTFRSFERLEDVFVRRGLRIVTVGCGTAEPDPTWQRVAHRVDEWIVANCSELDGFTQYRDDQAHLRRHIEAGELLGGCLVAVRP